jgi:type II secretory pathway component PulJ
MTPHRQEGFTVITVLILATVLFSLISLSLAAGYHLHRQNRKMVIHLQDRAEKLGDAGSVSGGPVL